MLRALLNALATLLLAVVLAGCGTRGAAPASTPSTKPSPAATSSAPTVYPDDPQLLARATSSTQRGDLKRLWTDTIAMQRAARTSGRSTLKGDPAVRRTTSAFIDDLDTSTIDDLSKNRAIDHAAAAVATVCEQCFQQLEAMRPIPAIAH